MIKAMNEKDRLECAWELIQNAHKLLGIQCQNCVYYKPNKDMDGYKGTCHYSDIRDTYWSEYCDEFDGWSDISIEEDEVEDDR